ncbi:MAG: hypothetical protein ACR2PZ_06405 [Pseudomonadales bacterium]
MTERKDEHLQRVDELLEDLTRKDAAESLVQDTLDHVRRAQQLGSEPSASRDRWMASGLAAAVVAFASVGLVYQQLGDQWAAPATESLTSIYSTDRAERPGSAGHDRSDLNAAPGQYAERENERLESRIAQAPKNGERASVAGEIRQRADADGPMADQAGVGTSSEPADSAPAAPVPTLEPLLRDYMAGAERYRQQLPGRQLEDRASISEVLVSESEGGGNEAAGSFAYDNQKAQSNKREGLSKGDSMANRALREPKSRAKRALVDELEADRRGGLAEQQTKLNELSPRAEGFLAGYQNVEGLEFLEPVGYWANSYLPGDPVMRRLEAQLRAGYPEALATTLERNAQPFDTPVNSALGVYLQASQAAVKSPGRIQLQVGLQAAQRQAGVRPPMNVAVVLDLPGTVDVVVAQQVRALLTSLNEQRQTNDRFSVTVAGVPGGEVVRPDDYRHGTVVTFTEQLVSGELEGATLDLVNAFAAGVDRLAADDDPNAVLGSSLVLLVSADGIESKTRVRLETLAHRSAVAGMPVSVVALAGVNGLDMEDISLAGQGRLRALGAAAEASRIIDKELYSASRTVARAVRLRIQLAAGVRLVNVIDSYRLDEQKAQRVREAELSIDQRLSRNWGIQADRGEDEDGIQIVIPGMAAGQSHVVLLDVVVDGPGEIADVRARYKDLIRMGNGVARASLSLADADSASQVRGPLELNVLKNLVAIEIADAARRSGRILQQGQVPAARQELINALALLTELRRAVPSWERDAELLLDEQRLTQFVQQLDAGKTDMLAAALEYAAFRKRLPGVFEEYSSEE